MTESELTLYTIQIFFCGMFAGWSFTSAFFVYTRIKKKDSYKK